MKRFIRHSVASKKSVFGIVFLIAILPILISDAIGEENSNLKRNQINKIIHEFFDEYSGKGKYSVPDASEELQVVIGLECNLQCFEELKEYFEEGELKGYTVYYGYPYRSVVFEKTYGWIFVWSMCVALEFDHRHRVEKSYVMSLC